ncbi:MAG TPA: S8 family serine peptidase [Spongiibacteraceae bacterium]
MQIYRALLSSFCVIGVLLACDSLALAASHSPERQILITVADSGAADFERDYHRPGYSMSWSARQAIASIQREYGFEQINGWPIDILHIYCVVMEASVGADVAAQITRLQSDRRVKLVQPMHLFRVHAGPNDPYFSLQYGEHAAQIEQWHQRATGRGVNVAIIDTGVDRQHPDLRQRLRLARNFVDNDSSFDTDIHGTAVAGIIAATANNGIGIVGIAPEANLLALKACWQADIRLIDAYCSSFTLAKALSFAIAQHVDIINLSLGGPDDPLLAQLLQEALARGILLVAAQNQDNEFPADVPGVIAVTETADNAFIARTSVARRVALAANARELLSTSPGGHYDFFSGSSMAAARVTGLSALMRQDQQQLTSAQLLDNLERWVATPTAVARSR